MPALTKPRHEAFARAIVAQLGGKYRSQGAAYVAAGYAASTEKNSAESAASRLLKTVEPIAARISELQEQAARRKKVTVDSIVEELDEARQVAKEASQPSAMVAASTGKAKILGLVVDRTEQGKPGDFTQADSPKAIARSLLKQAGMADSEIESEYGEGATLAALEALAHFQETLRAIVDGVTSGTPSH